ncbi:putative short chain dehydrogenase/reductase [Mycena galopus ATCC 62051]|nr:putative short chain dehydrogenase/reductase [Mycena galopus ATCC 62051]
MASTKTLVLVTGASSGIGYETVLAFAQASPDFHILLCSRSLDKGQKVLDQMRSEHGDSLKGTISVLQLEVTDPASIAAAKDHVESSFGGKLDILISNAGIIVTKPCDTITNLRETFETNVFGAALVTEAFEPLLKKAEKPLLVYVSSGQGSCTLRLDPEAPHREIRGDTYRMSKAAMNMLAACHKYNFHEWGCRVCSFNPGFCVTDLTGSKGREMRVKLGARTARDPALALVDIALGKRDADIEKSGIVDLDGGVLPW